MANEIQTAPSTTLADNDDWQQELNLRELSMKGYDGISLTEWAAGDTDRPQIAAGSVIEIDGAIAKFTNQTAITDEVGIADGWCYIKFVVSGADVTPTLTNTFGTWDTAKQGFYDSGDRYSLHKMYRSGAVTKIFTEKSVIGNSQNDIGKTFDGAMFFNGTTKFTNLGSLAATAGSVTNPAAAHKIPAGIYYVYIYVAAPTVNLGLVRYRDSGGTVRIIVRAGFDGCEGMGGLMISDGDNLEIQANAGTVSYYYTRIF